MKYLEPVRTRIVLMTLPFFVMLTIFCSGSLSVLFWRLFINHGGTVLVLGLRLGVTLVLAIFLVSFCRQFCFYFILSTVSTFVLSNRAKTLVRDLIKRFLSVLLPFSSS